MTASVLLLVGAMRRRSTGSGGREDVGRPARAQTSSHTLHMSEYTPDKSGPRADPEPVSKSCADALVSRSYLLLINRRRAKRPSIHVGS